MNRPSKCQLLCSCDAYEMLLKCYRRPLEGRSPSGFGIISEVEKNMFPIPKIGQVGISALWRFLCYRDTCMGCKGLECNACLSVAHSHTDCD